MKNCIFDSKKPCNNCGECDICELNREKKCDNCGICLQLEGVDIKAVKIDEIKDKLNKEKVLKVTGDVDLSKAKIDLKPKFQLDDLKTSKNDEDTKAEYPVEEDDLAKEEIYKESLKDLSLEDLDLETDSMDIMDKEDMWEYIDDVENLSEILADNSLTKNYTHEEFPGFVVYNRSNKDK